MFCHLRNVILWGLASSVLMFCTVRGMAQESDQFDTKKFVLGDLIKPFSPPTLKELDARTEWVEQPVLDSFKLLQEHQRSEKPLASVERALTLENTSPRANKVIRSALGRLPTDDKEVDWNATITRHVVGDVRSTNPLMISSTTEFDVVGLTGYGLFSFDWRFRNFASSDSVVSWNSSKDGLVDKIILRNDLTWSDGEPITAHDVEFSFNAIMSSQVPVPALRNGTDKLRFVKAYNNHTIVFFHKRSLVTNSSNMNFTVIPKHVYRDSIAEDPTLLRSEYHRKLDIEPVVGGPYIIKKRSLHSEIVLSRRTEYYMHKGKQVRAKPYFKEVRFKIIPDPAKALLAMKTGEIEEMQMSVDQWNKNRDHAFNARNKSVYGTEWVYFYFGWNCKSLYFSDRRTRQAMSYAFDHTKLIEDLRHGVDEPGSGIFHPKSRWAPKNTSTYKQDLGKAKKLLADAGWRDTDGDGVRDKVIDGRKIPFEFSILCTRVADRIEICRLLQTNLRDVGVTCRVVPQDFFLLQRRSRDHRFDAMLGGWGTGTDPDTADNLWVEGAGRNYVNYANEEVDKLFEKGRREFDAKKREAIYSRIHEILWEDQPYTWLYWRNSYYAFNKSLRGYNFSPRGPYNYGPGFGSIWKPVEKK